MDGKGLWIDNVFIERFWRSLKYKEVYLRAYESLNKQSNLSVTTLPTIINVDFISSLIPCPKLYVVKSLAREASFAQPHSANYLNIIRKTHFDFNTDSIGIGVNRQTPQKVYSQSINKQRSKKSSHQTKPFEPTFCS